MALYIADAAYDAYFAYFTACTRQDLVSDEATPTTLTNTLAHVAMAGGDYSIGDGGSAGRKLTMAAKSNVAVTHPGTTRHAVLSLDGTIRLVTTCSERVVSAEHSDEVNMASWYLDVSGPQAPE